LPMKNFRCEMDGATVPGEPAGAARHRRWAHSPKPYRAAGPQARRR